jgi:cytochrome c
MKGNAMLLRVATVLSLCLTVPAFAGDAAKGEADFKKCKACHSIIGADGAEIQKGGKTGPNLFGIVGKPVASSADFKYGDGILEAKEKGVVWDEALIAEYVADPGAFLKKVTGDDKAKTKMTFKLTKGGEDMAAYLATLK